jgi:hypothetical protein
MGFGLRYTRLQPVVDPAFIIFFLHGSEFQEPNSSSTPSQALVQIEHPPRIFQPDGQGYEWIKRKSQKDAE